MFAAQEKSLSPFVSAQRLSAAKGLTSDSETAKSKTTPIQNIKAEQNQLMIEIEDRISKKNTNPSTFKQHGIPSQL